MQALAAPNRRIFPDILSVLAVYALVTVGAYFIAREILGAAPNFPDIEGRLPVVILAVLPLSLVLIFAVRLRSLALDLRAHRFGARLRTRLTLLFLVSVAAASVPQGLFLLRLAMHAQSTAAATEVRQALASGSDLALSWYDEELMRLSRAATAVVQHRASAWTDGSASAPDAESLLEELRSREPAIEAVELFKATKSVDFAGSDGARLVAAVPALAPGQTGQLLPASSSAGVNRIRYAAAWPPLGSDGKAVLTLRLPENLEASAELLGRASATAELMAPFSRRYANLLALLYLFLVVPLLLLAALFGLSAADMMAEPLASIEDATRKVAGGELGVRLIVKGHDETSRLVASFNRMLDDIQRGRSDELRREKIDAWKDIAQRLAHELKNPLTPIRLTAERVLRRLRADPAQALDVLESSMIAIVKEVEGMDALLSDFRSFASLPEPQRDWVDIRGLVAEATALYAASYPDIAFSLDGMPSGVLLRIDGAAIKRALGNLLANAVDAMGGRGRVEIAADLVAAADSRYCRLRIRDSGAGIPPSIGEKVFVPYFTTKPMGTGLGLSIVERIIADHGGAVRFESEEGAGTTFFIDLPFDR